MLRSITLYFIPFVEDSFLLHWKKQINKIVAVFPYEKIAIVAINKNSKQRKDRKFDDQNPCGSDVLYKIRCFNLPVVGWGL